MIYLAIGNVVFMLEYIVGKICATYEYNKKIYIRSEIMNNYNIEDTIWVDKDTDLGKFIHLFDEVGIAHSIVENADVGTRKVTLLVFSDNMAVAFDEQAKYVSFVFGK